MSAAIDAWLSSYIDNPHFRNALESDLEMLDPAQRVKVRMELLSYVVPHVKGIEPTTPDQKLHTIQIIYKEAKPPRKAR